jgi:hypothetical protein
MRKFILTASALVLGSLCLTVVHAREEHKGPPARSHDGNTRVSQPERMASTKAKGPGLEISGETSTNFYLFKTKRTEENRGKGRGTHLGVEDSRLNFEVFGKASECLGGLEYSFLIGISGNPESGENPIQENRIKLKGEWGTFLAGDTRGFTDFGAVGVFYFLGGTGGILGNYKEVINETTGTVIRDDLTNRFTPKDQTKLIYITPRVYGFQAGYSFTPDGSHKGEEDLHSHTPTTAGVRSVVGDARFAGSNISEYGINFKKKFAQCVDVAASFTAMNGGIRDLRRLLVTSPVVNQANAPWPRHRLNAYAIGAVLEWAGISIGGEFLNNQKSGQLKALNGCNLGKVYTVGAGYKTGPNAFSLAYLHSKRDLGHLGLLNFGHTKSDVVSLTYDRTIAPGLEAYMEGVLFKMKASQPGLLANWHTVQNGFGGDVIGPNRGRVFDTGIRIKF